IWFSGAPWQLPPSASTDSWSAESNPSAGFQLTIDNWQLKIGNLQFPHGRLDRTTTRTAERRVEPASDRDRDRSGRDRGGDCRSPHATLANQQQPTAPLRGKSQAVESEDERSGEFCRGQRDIP